MRFRICSKDTDKQAVMRIWREIGWMEHANEDSIAALLDSVDGLVAEIKGEPEALAFRSPGTVRHLDRELGFTGIMAVGTSHVARKQGLAARLTARSVAGAAAEGAHVAGLGIFDQGFYDRLGFGTGGYEHRASLDPSSLQVDHARRSPSRLSQENWKEMHEARFRRRLGHGSVCFERPEVTRETVLCGKNGFGLGYYDGPSKALSHFIWVHPDGTENGPYWVSLMIYDTREQFLELMGLLRNLGDQVYLVRMREPRDAQLQDLVREPFRLYRTREGAKFSTGIAAFAPWQVRVCDLAGCLSATKLSHEPVRFNLTLDDPIGKFLDEDSPWQGIGGQYVVTLGPESSAETGYASDLPALEASVGAFTRLWLGVRPASSLAMTDQLRGPEALLAQLDRVLCLPEPKPDWDF